GKLREVPMLLDTLLVDSDAKTVLLTWRGLVATADDDLGAEQTVLLASERRADPPLPVSFYAGEIEAFEADPLGIQGFVPPDVLAERDRAMAQLEATKAAVRAPADGRSPEEIVADKATSALPDDHPDKA